MKINWELVCLLLGTIGMSLAAVCFTIWMTMTGKVKIKYVADDVTDADEQPTEVWPGQ